MPHPVKRPSPLSIRLSEAERSQLEMRAGSRPLGAYVKGVIFGVGAPVARRRLSADTVLLGQLLAVLGRSRIAGNLEDLASAANSGSLGLHDETIERLEVACDDIRLVHNALMRALGKEERTPSGHEVRLAFNFAASDTGTEQ
jgi:hypothetical protein